MASQAEKFLGKWKLEKNDEGWTEYMKACGVGAVSRKLGNSVTTYEHWKMNGDIWTLEITSVVKSKTLTFKMGSEFDYATLDGRNIKCTVIVKGDKLVMYQKAIKENEISSEVIREILSDGRLLATYVALNEKKVTGKRYFAPTQP